VFNLFGLIPWNPRLIPVLGPFLMIGAWQLIISAFTRVFDALWASRCGSR
jgi:hypothetical protein